ncbi:MAG: hypothetical protein MI864_09580, partial [Pseudomonadales bacterium]|nr:hypothetical protein [Pseudomonadales bacterium]
MMSRFFFEAITDSYLSPNSPLLGSIFLDVLIHPAVAVLYSATFCFSVVYLHKLLKPAQAIILQ